MLPTGLSPYQESKLEKTVLSGDYREKKGLGLGARKVRFSANLSSIPPKPGDRKSSGKGADAVWPMNAGIRKKDITIKNKGKDITCGKYQ